MYLQPGVYVVVIENIGFNSESCVAEVFSAQVTQRDFYLSESISIVAGSAFDFSLSVIGPITIIAGRPGSFPIQVYLISGLPQAVNLFVSGLPFGTSATIIPSSGNYTFNSVCIITTSPSTPLGSYTVTLTGTSGEIVHSTTFVLVINSPSYSPQTPERQ